MKIERILNPVDGSDHSVNATRYAVELANVFNAKIILLYCHERYPIVLAEPYFQEAVNKINKSAEERVNPFIEILDNSGVQFDVRMLEGPAGSRIPDVAQIEKIDLIVMGSRGMGDFAGLILGSVAHQVLHKSSCPVFIAK
jgi:nucleotide-binding universal stress UspA family protein